MACTQGSGTSLADTLAHSYTPIVHLDPLLASIKGRSRPSCGRVVTREDGLTNRLALSPSRTLVTPTASASPWRRITRATFSPLVFHLAPTYLGWDTQRHFYSSVQGPPGSKRRQYIRTLHHSNKNIIKHAKQNRARYYGHARKKKRDRRSYGLEVSALTLNKYELAHLIQCYLI